MHSVFAAGKLEGACIGVLIKNPNKRLIWFDHLIWLWRQPLDVWMFDDKVLLLLSHCSELHPVPTINICSVKQTVLHCHTVHCSGVYSATFCFWKLNVFLCFKSSSHDKYLQCEFYCIFRTGLQLLDPNIRLHFSFKIFALSCSRIFGSFSVLKANVFLQFQFPG